MISPEDPYFLEGQDLELICRRRNNVKAPHLYFKRGMDAEVLDSSYLKKLNDSAVKLTIPNLTAHDVESHYHSMSYECYNNRSKSGRSDTCIANTYVRLDCKFFVVGYQTLNFNPSPPPPPFEIF